MKRDLQATAARHFLDKRSYVTPDGREVLYKEDWQARKKELWERCGGRCEWIIGSESLTGLIRCLVTADDPHHIIPRRKGRDDSLSNLQALCRYHHNLLDKRRPMWTTWQEGCERG